MKILAKAGTENIAIVYIAELASGKQIEFVESVQPPFPREKKWVIIISSLYGCPVKCRFCDAGGSYHGKLTKNELLSQIDFLIMNRFSSKNVNSEKFKIQFARMGEPAFNNNVLDVLRELPFLYKAPGLLPSLSTIAPKGSEDFFENLLKIKDELYRGKFQLQFSIHTTDTEQRDWLIPVDKWGFAQIAEYGERFFKTNDRKITLNFALGKNSSISPDVLLKYFNPEKFLIKITPINPTFQANKNSLDSCIVPEKIDYLKKAGYSVILSIGELEENNIGSNCGQYLTNYIKSREKINNSYTYEIQSV